MIAILTYEDLRAAGDSEDNRIAFITKAISEHKGSQAYKKAQEAQAYYDGENPTIMHLEKVLYDFQGLAHRDLYSANHKIASNFFGIVVDQEVSYLLRNGITWDDEATGKKLGKDFHRRVADVLEAGAIEGISFGFWNLDHLEIFHFADAPDHPGFVPLYGADTGLLMAGIKYWQVDDSKPVHMILYEADGVTEYRKDRGQEIVVEKEKHGYKTLQTVQRDTGAVVAEADGGNYKKFPIVPFRYKKNGQSEMQGKRNTLDALDLVTSNMVNNVDEGNLIYWILKNCGGMDDLDDRQFIEQLKVTHVAHADGDEGASVEAHTVEAPFEGNDKAIERLESRLYKDFRAFNEAAITAGNQTATAILASYVPLDGKTDKNEDNISDFISAILEIAEIEDEPSYTRSRIINAGEEVQMVLSAAEYLGDEYTTEKILTILGDADRLREIQDAKAAEASDRYRQQEAELEKLKQQNQGQGQNDLDE